MLFLCSACLTFIYLQFLDLDLQNLKNQKSKLNNKNSQKVFKSNPCLVEDLYTPLLIYKGSLNNIIQYIKIYILALSKMLFL